MIIYEDIIDYKERSISILMKKKLLNIHDIFSNNDFMSNLAVIAQYYKIILEIYRFWNRKINF